MFQTFCQLLHKENRKVKNLVGKFHCKNAMNCILFKGENTHFLYLENWHVSLNEL